MSRKSRVAGAAGIIMLGMLLSRLLGYVREQQIAHVFGADFRTDAFWAAFMVPDLLYNLLAGGALSAAFIPVFSEYLARDAEDEAWKIASGVLNVMMVALILAVLSIIAFTPFMVSLVTRFDINNPSYLLCIRLTRLMAPVVLLHAVNGLATAMLQSRKNFIAPSMIWLVYNIAIIVAALLAGNRIEVLTYGVVAGAALMVIIQYIILWRGGMRYGFREGLSHPGVRQVIILFPTAMFGLAVNYLSLTWLPQFFGSGISEGVVTYIRYATRVIILPVGLFATAISTAVFPFLSDMNENRERFRELIASGLRAVFLFAIPSTVGLIMLRTEITNLLWEGGRFSPADTMATAALTMFFAFGLLGQSALPLVARGFYARKDTLTPALAGLGGLIVNLLLALLLMPRFGSAAIAIAASAAVTINMVILIELLRRRLGGIEGRQLLATFAKVSLASLLMAGAIYAALPLLTAAYALMPFAAQHEAGSKLFNLFVTGGSMLTGVIIFAGAVTLMRIPEAELLRREIARRFGRQPIEAMAAGTPQEADRLQRDEPHP